LGDTQGSAKLDEDRNIVFSNLSGTGVFQRK
jgi:hypothetical protein